MPRWLDRNVSESERETAWQDYVEIHPEVLSIRASAPACAVKEPSEFSAKSRPAGIAEHCWETMQTWDRALPSEIKEYQDKKKEQERLEAYKASGRPNAGTKAKIDKRVRRQRTRRAK